MRRSRAARQGGTSLLEAVVALGMGSLALAATAEQVAAGAAHAQQARLLAHAMSAARSVLDAALAAPCAAIETASAACDPAFTCVIATRSLGTRPGETGMLDVVHVEVSVTAADPDASLESEERTLARLVSVAARPQACA